MQFNTWNNNILLFNNLYKPELLKIEAKLTIKSYLMSYGFSICEQKSVYTNDLFNAAKLLLEKYLDPEDSFDFDTIQKLKEVKKGIFRYKDEFNLSEELLLQLNKCNVIEILDNENNFRINKNNFFGGDWLEYYVYGIIKKLVNENLIQEALHGVEVRAPDYMNKVVDGKNNELDIAFIANNKFYIVECKTGQLKGDKSENIIYKLDSLKNTYGSMSEAFLISNLERVEKIESRSNNFKINYIEKKNLSNLEENIRNKLLANKNK